MDLEQYKNDLMTAEEAKAKLEALKMEQRFNSNAGLVGIDGKIAVLNRNLQQGQPVNPTPFNIPDRISNLENQDRLRSVQYDQSLNAFETFDQLLGRIEELLGRIEELLRRIEELLRRIKERRGL